MWTAEQARKKAETNANKVVDEFLARCYAGNNDHRQPEVVS